jgi:hypothetical protein
MAYEHKNTEEGKPTVIKKIEQSDFEEKEKNREV